jgi:hypothetical protein
MKKVRAVSAARAGAAPLGVRGPLQQLFEGGPPGASKEYHAAKHEFDGRHPACLERAHAQTFEAMWQDARCAGRLGGAQARGPGAYLEKAIPQHVSGPGGGGFPHGTRGAWRTAHGPVDTHAVWRAARGAWRR